ncbi:5'-nucleotidase C-terminal domain-containing protein [Actinopolymorpha sp. NPDC004070]|uniref:bifunctional metallophosphatase/5'-nucleotidase n=1 Tax=Actinopolymorpha sp. NPDC004070 TaxID=3154548 RepID=UPI0033A3D461
MPQTTHAERTLVGRRSVLTGGAAAILAAAGFRATPAWAAGVDAARPADGSHRLTVMGTTDLHGNVFNWDYFADREFGSATNPDDIGLAKVSSLVNAVRTERGRGNTLLIDAGDTIQGTPLAYYYARIEPISKTRVHPMAAAMNAIGYDAAALGNHEFNYGIPLLRMFEDQLDFPLLGANALNAHSGRPAFQPYVIKLVRFRGMRPVRVGILGLTNPGIAIWDKANVEGRMTFPGLVEQAKVWVPKMRRAGCDVVIVSAHSGADTSSSYGDALPWPENASTLVAEQVPGIDAILVGHAHVEIAERFVTNKETGSQVVLTEPSYWGRRLSLIELDLRWSARNGWSVVGRGSQVLNSNTVPEDPEIVALLKADHDAVVTYVNSPIGTSKVAMSASTARYEDTPALDFVNYVQADAVKKALAGTAAADLPVLSIAAPFNKDAQIPAGQVSVRDVAGLYIYDNTLLAVRFTGAQLKAYLEQSAVYFRQVDGVGPYAPDDVTNAPTENAPRGTPDYNYDVVAGLDAPLTYDIDIAKPVGQRITGLSYAGAPVADDQEFALAVNNYRQSGGGNFPGVSTAEVLYNAQVEIRQLLIDWVTAAGEIDPTVFFSRDWQLVANGTPVIIQP